jgi:hypothetical protein
VLKLIRILIAIATHYDYEIWQIDVKTAFLNGNMTRDVYMIQPEGFVNTQNYGEVCKLRKSTYGLKQASRSWILRFDEVICQFGFIKSEEEPCVYMKFSGSAKVFLMLYIDDILRRRNDISMILNVKTYMEKSISMKDLEQDSCILGIKIYKDRS